MDLVNRYLHAVKFWLPRAQQDDIIAELGDDLRSQIQDREAALGHPLDDDAVAAILAQRGHPMWVAGRYLPQRPVIGSALAPAYWFVQRLVILWVLVPVFVLVVGPAAVLGGKNPSATLIQLPWTLLMAAIFAFGTITLVFAIMERHPHESFWKWNPKRLPRVPRAQAAPVPQPVSGYAAIGEMFTSAALVVCWCYVMWLREGSTFTTCASP